MTSAERVLRILRRLTREPATINQLVAMTGFETRQDSAARPDRNSTEPGSLRVDKEQMRCVDVPREIDALLARPASASTTDQEKRGEADFANGIISNQLTITGKSWQSPIF